MKIFKNKKINNILNDYPCSDYLHNALRFIAHGKPEVAYDEICYAIIYSGGSLSEEENRLFKDKELEELEEMVDRVFIKTELSKEELIETFEQKGLAGVYRLGMEHMFNYLNR